MFFIYQLILETDPSLDAYDIVDTRRIINEDRISWPNLLIGIIELAVIFFIYIPAKGFCTTTIATIFLVDAVYALLSVKVFAMMYYYEPHYKTILKPRTSIKTRSTLLCSNARYHFVPFVFGVLFLVYVFVS